MINLLSASLSLCALLCLGVTTGLARQPSTQRHPMADHILIVYNQNDPDSELLAHYYAKKRAIPGDRIFGLQCPTEEEIGRAAFQQTILTPLDKYMRDKGWLQRHIVRGVRNDRVVRFNAAKKNEIWAIVLMRGVPLKIRPDPTIREDITGRKELLRDEASVDSELATLPILGRARRGLIPNHLFFLKKPRAFGAEDAKAITLVTRLDGPTADDVRRMIDDSIHAEQNRLTGVASLDLRGLNDAKNPYSAGDNWLKEVETSLRAEGWPLVIDRGPKVFPANQPWNDVAIYYGWYTVDARGPLFHPPRRFSRGAVAYHIHSFSAATVRNPRQKWVGPFIRAGASATMGAVYEPYLDLTPHINVFNQRLLEGYTFAEAAYMSQKVISWMVVMVGDPLYRPFRHSLADAESLAFRQRSPHYDWLKLQFTRQSLHLGVGDKKTAQELKNSLTSPRATHTAYEGLADLLLVNKIPDSNSIALKAYEQAIKLSTAPIDQIRAGQKLATLLERQGKKSEAESVLQSLALRWPQQAEFYGLAEKTPDRAQAPPAPKLAPKAIPAAKTVAQGEQEVITTFSSDTTATRINTAPKSRTSGPPQPPQPLMPPGNKPGSLSTSSSSLHTEPSKPR